MAAVRLVIVGSRVTAALGILRTRLEDWSVVVLESPALASIARLASSQMILRSSETSHGLFSGDYENDVA